MRPALLFALMAAAVLPMAAAADSDIDEFRTAAGHALLRGQEAFQVSLHQQADGSLRVHLTVAPGYYVYRDKINISAVGARVGHLVLPPARILQAPVLGGEPVYSGDVELVVERLGFEPVGEATIKVQLQGCHPVAQVCYPPQTFTFPVRRVLILGS